MNASWRWNPGWRPGKFSRLDWSRRLRRNLSVIVDIGSYDVTLGVQTEVKGSAPATGVFPVPDSTFRFRMQLAEVTRIVCQCLFCLVTVATAGCQGGPSAPSAERHEASEALAELLADSGRTVGGMDRSSADGLLAHVLHARILPDGAVLSDDDVSPFLRVFDTSDGHLLGTALQRGEGPEEGGPVLGMDVSGAGRVMVLTVTGLREYEWTGDSLRFVRAYPLPRDRLLVTLASRCGRGWVAYAPPLQSGGSGEIVAVGSRDTSGHLAWTPAVPWPTDVHRIWLNGSPYQMSSDSAHVFLRHVYHPRAPILSIPCRASGDSVRVVRYTKDAAANDAASAEEGGTVFRYTFPDTLYTGFATLRGRLIESARVRVSPERAWTLLSVSSVSDPADRKSVALDGGWWIMDGRAGEVLLYAEDPEPHLVMVPAGALLEALGD